jgi:hypothetical protein
MNMLTITALGVLALQAAWVARRADMVPPAVANVLDNSWGLLLSFGEARNRRPVADPQPEAPAQPIRRQEAPARQQRQEPAAEQSEQDAVMARRRRGLV